jgi:hypothetical protein
VHNLCLYTLSKCSQKVLGSSIARDMTENVCFQSLKLNDSRLNQ